MQELKIPLLEVQNMYHFEFTFADSKHHCIIILNTKRLGVGSDEDRDVAKEKAENSALKFMMKSYEYKKLFRITVPSANGSAPTEDLLRFLRKNTVNGSLEELQGGYQFKIRHVNGNSFSVFDCRLIFKGVELGIGQGDTKCSARMDASRKALLFFQKTIDNLSVTQLERLDFPACSL